MKQEITYRELRTMTEDIILFVKKMTGDQNVTISSRIEEEIGITGDDAGELLNCFIEKYEVDFEEFEFDRYFYGEGLLEWYELPLAPILFVIGVLQLILLGVSYIFYKPFIGKIKKFSLHKIITTIRGNKTEKKELTIGDLITSAIEKRFLTRAEIQYVLKK